MGGVCVSILLVQMPDSCHVGFGFDRTNRAPQHIEAKDWVFVGIFGGCFTGMFLNEFTTVQDGCGALIEEIQSI